MLRALAVLTVLILTTAIGGAQQQADSDGDSIPDFVEQQIGTDPARAERLELIADDGTGAADTSRKSACIPGGDYSKVWFAPVARGRYLWRIETAGEVRWPQDPYEVRILYIDADNDPATGRPDNGPGCDIMLYPDRANRLIEWPEAVRSIAVAHGNALYFVADLDLNQVGGRSVFRMQLLYQDTREGQDDNGDTVPWFGVSAAGESTHPPMPVAPDHPLYSRPQEIRSLGARVLFDEDRPRAEVTFITELPARPVVEYGTDTDYGSSAAADKQWNNHRVILPGLEEGRTYHYRVRVGDARGEVVTDNASFATVRPQVFSGGVVRQVVPLLIDNPDVASAGSVPITAGVPFPPGALASDTNLRLLDVQGREVPLQSEVTAWHPDGSVRWVLLDFLADVAAGDSTRCTVEFGSEVRRSVETDGISIRREADTVVVDTGVLEATFHAEASGEAVPAARRNDNGRIAMALPLRALCSSGGRIYDSSLAPAEIEIERAGPIAAVIRVSGTHVNADGSALFRYISRYHFTARSGLVRVAHTIENDQVEQALTRIDQYEMPLTVLTGGVARVSVEGGDAVPLIFDGADGDCSLTQDLHDHWTLSAPGIEREGTNGPSAIGVSSTDWGLWIGLRHFSQMWPSELAWDAGGTSLRVGILPAFDDHLYAERGDAIESDRLYYHVREGGYRLHSGVSFTRDIWLGCHDGEEWPQSWAAQLREPLIAVAEPEWYCASGAFGPQLPRAQGRFEAYEVMVDRVFEGLMRRREANGSYGFLNFGDWWGERRFNWGNSEYDTPLAHMVQFIRTGRREFFDNALAAARHSRDVDFVHHHASPEYVGRTYYHRMFHTGGYQPRMTEEEMDLAYAHDTSLTSPLAGHQWNRGLLTHYYMTGEERSRDIALGLGDYMAGPGTVAWTMGDTAERCAAWAMYDVLTNYEATWDPFYLNAARIMVEEALRRQTPEGHWGMVLRRSEVTPSPIGGFAYFSGLLITMLDHYNRYAADPRVDQMILKATEWLLRDEYMANKQGFRVCSCETFNERTRAGDGAWSAANAMAIGWRLSGDERYLDAAQTSFAHFIPTARDMGKDYSTALVNSPQLIQILHSAGRDSLDIPR